MKKLKNRMQTTNGLKLGVPDKAAEALEQCPFNLLYNINMPHDQLLCGWDGDPEWLNMKM